MPSTGFVSRTGSGTALLSGGTVVTALAWATVISAVTTQRVRVPAAATGGRYQFAGRFGLSVVQADQAAVNKDFVDWGTNVHYVDQAGALSPSVSADKLWWVLPPGITVYIRIDW